MKRSLMVFGVVLVVSGMIRESGAQVQISEFLASNVSVNPDNYDFDDFSDWIELHNTGSAAADIDGFYLTDDLKQPKKWQFPAGTSIPANGYLLIWADDHDGKPGQSETRDWYPFTQKYSLKAYHAVFKLNKDGEQVGLFTAAGEVVDSVTFPKQFADVSMGRTAEGSWAFFDEPTPAAANMTAAKPLATAQRSGDVVFSVEGGMYPSAQTITLTAPDGGGIYYTTDGSIPYASDNQYSAAIPVSKTTIIRARVIGADKFAGKVITNTYFIGEKARKVMVVSLSTDQAFLDDPDFGIWKNNMKGREIPAALEFFTTDGTRVARFNAGVRNGTLTSFNAKQHPLQVALRKRYGDLFVEYKFFDKPITKFSRFRLRQGGDVWATNFIGDALLDPINKGQSDVGIQAFTPTVAYVNGSYYGLMNLREQFREYYFTENFGVDPTTRDEVRTTLLPGNGMMGGANEGWALEQGTWDSWRSLMTLVKSGTMDAAKFNQVKSLVDIASLSDFVAFVHFGKAISWGHNEQIWKVPDGKWRWLETDFDRAWVYKDAMSGGIDLNQFVNGAGVSGAIMQRDTLFSKLVANTEYKNYFIQRYAAHLNSTLKSSRLVTITDSIATMVEPEMADHAGKWGGQGGIRSVSAWQKEINDIKKFMTDRPEYCWEHLVAAPFGASGGRSDLTVKLNPADAAADIFVNGVRMSQGITAISLFNGIAFQVKAVGKPGWKCSGWEGGSGSTDSLTVTLDGNKTVTVNFSTAQINHRDAGGALPAGMRFAERLSVADGRLSLRIDITSGGSEQVEAVLYDIAGKKMETLINRRVTPGTHRLRMQTKAYASGVYCYRLHIGSSVLTKMVSVP